MALFDITTIVYLCYLGIGFIAGRVFMSIEFALLKPKYQSYKVLNQGEEYEHTPAVKMAHRWDIIDTTHATSRQFHNNVVVMNPTYYRDMSPQEMTVDYFRAMKNQAC